MDGETTDAPHRRPWRSFIGYTRWLRSLQRRRWQAASSSALAYENDLLAPAYAIGGAVLARMRLAGRRRASYARLFESDTMLSAKAWKKETHLQRRSLPRRAWPTLLIERAASCLLVAGARGFRWRAMAASSTTYGGARSHLTAPHPVIQCAEPLISSKVLQEQSVLATAGMTRTPLITASTFKRA